MSNLLKKIEHEALKLSGQERAFLADRLLSSLDEDTLTDMDAAWIAETERRYQEYKEGKRPGVSSQEVFSEVNRMLR